MAHLVTPSPPHTYPPHCSSSGATTKLPINPPQPPLLSILSYLHQGRIHHSQPSPVASHPCSPTGSSVPTGENLGSLPVSQLSLALCRAGDLGQMSPSCLPSCLLLLEPLPIQPVRPLSGTKELKLENQTDVAVHSLP